MDVTTYQKYKDSRNLAWQILIEHKIIQFPVNIIALVNDFKINLVPFNKAGYTLMQLQPINNRETYAIKLYNKYYIIYDQTIPDKILRFAIAHELGHILLNHCREDLELIEQSNYNENQANIFASRLLSPAIVAKIEKLTTAEQISSFFGISMESAIIRAERLDILYKRNKFLTSPLEKEYYELYLQNK